MHPSSMGWFSPAPFYQEQQHSALFASPLAPSSWTNAGVPSSPPDFLLPFHHYPHKDHNAGPSYPVLRSETSSTVSRDSDLSPSPEVAEVVCNAPLVAPIPLPYHSPTFLLYDLPDEDEDLSHPPYTHRPHKRKRARDDEGADDDANAEREAPHPVPAKRRSIGLPGLPRWESQSGSSAAAHAPSQSAGVPPPTANSASAAAAPSLPAALRHPTAAFARRHRAR
ncbi:hypothetical protein PYCCODRAFT_1468512 [Trametes coccinea BRFM310]|uniref:Uncharacterized protein n=1 Tax=Trametes coccinea (strain BRFM310) TaxID=1353009 RepID=A0A1Y2IKI1_TRAC3|nr:hypothetical protein PYCCODRAFT_1468512 [Trametes coccinea BRFM310]